jgi:plastocyanin
MTMHQKNLAATLLSAAMLIALLCGALYIRQGFAASDAKAAVTIDNYAFSPVTLTVKRGTTVTWTNKDDDVHTVKSDAGPVAFKSSALDTDDSFTVTFDKAGTYQYICSIHPHMHGKIVVQ